MSARRAVPNKGGTLSVRIKSEERSLIDRAAKLRGKSIADFVLDAARAAAEEAVLGQAVTMAGSEAYVALLARLDMPAQPNERLRQTMRTKVPWDEV